MPAAPPARPSAPAAPKRPLYSDDERARRDASGWTLVQGLLAFAPAFFWEDAVSMLVLALHTACLAAMFGAWLSPRAQMVLALAAYGTYLINAAQFLIKLRAARLQAPRRNAQEGTWVRS